MASGRPPRAPSPPSPTLSPSFSETLCYSRPDAGINTLTRSGCPAQRCEEGTFYRQGSSRGRLLAATMEVMNISRGGNASAFCGNPQEHHDGINLVFTQHHLRVKERQSQVICYTRPTHPTPRGLCCARCARYRVCCFMDPPLWLFPTIASIRLPHRETPITPPHYEARFNELSTQEVSQSWTDVKYVVF